jgi:hypothetical protein
MVIDDVDLERGLEEETLVVDTRLRDALRTLRRDGAGRFALPSELGTPFSFPRPSLSEEAEFAAEAAALDESYVVRMQRRLDGLEQRLESLEPHEQGRP